MNKPNSSIKYLVMDVDGTLTDGKINIGPAGEVFKSFSAKDGCGIHDIAMPAGIIPVIITGRDSAIVSNRSAVSSDAPMMLSKKSKLSQTTLQHEMAATEL